MIDRDLAHVAIEFLAAFLAVKIDDHLFTRFPLGKSFFTNPLGVAPTGRPGRARAGRGFQSSTTSRRSQHTLYKCSLHLASRAVIFKAAAAELSGYSIKSGSSGSDRDA